jgi:alditol oxidase
MSSSSPAHNWAGTHTYAALRIATPRTVEELQQIVATEPRVRALGSRHSFNDLADTDGVLIDTSALPHSLEIVDEDTVKVAAWMRYGDIAAALEPHGLALHNLASLPHISVAGAVATGTHGSGDGNSNLAGAVAGFDLVDAHGELVSLQPVDDDFDGAVVSLGALGILTTVTLDVEPAFQVRQDVWDDLPWDAALENLDRITSAAYSVSMFTDWSGETIGSTWLKQLVPGKVRGELFGARRRESDRHPLPDIDSSPTTQQGGVPGLWSDRLPHFRMGFTPSSGEEIQTEYLVPRVNAIAALEVMRSLSPLVTPLLQITELRTMRADSLWMSGAYDTDCLNIHFTWKKLPTEVAAALPVIEAALLPLGARPHWGKWFDAGVEQIAPLYPRYEDFRALVLARDPERKFTNPYLSRVLGL